MKYVVKRTLGGLWAVKTAGGALVYVFDNEYHAVDYAKFRNTFTEDGDE